MAEYPECEKLKAVEKEHRGILEFCDYLMAKGIFFCDGRINSEGDIVPYSQPVQQLIYDCYGIDPDKLESERRAMLESIRGK
ncbi:hypothetical protein KAR91_77145 [Candidatus Pacearchaeota archaeon]|nr:hypothetical protein [Candidatus Pacearchaeota archaeon]